MDFKQIRNSEYKNFIDIVLSSDDKYVQHCTVLIASILLNNKSKYTYRFHILDGGISNKNKFYIEKLRKIQYFEIFYYEMDTYDFSFLPLNRENISVATYYRLEIINILPKDIEKVIYLDCDIVVDGDLAELWETDVSEVYSGVVEDESSIKNSKKLGLQNYFNAGVLLLNLKKLRENNFQDKWINYYENNQNIINLQDQDILNGVFNNNVKWLSLKWNANSTIFAKAKYKHFYTNEDEFYTKQNRIIIHFTEKYKPWNHKSYHPLRKIYFKYLLKTPFKSKIKKYVIIKIKQFIHDIFSITNQNFHKVITIFWIRIKFPKSIKIN